MLLGVWRYGSGVRGERGVELGVEFGIGLGAETMTNATLSRR